MSLSFFKVQERVAEYPAAGRPSAYQAEFLGLRV